jgi:hypothetical protein
VLGGAVDGGPEIHPVRLKLHRGITSYSSRIGAVIGQALYCAQIQLPDTHPPGLFSPNRRSPRGIRKPGDTVDQKERTPIDPDVSAISKGTGKPPDVLPVILEGRLLRDQDLMIEPIPPSRPVLVGPA